MKSVLQGEAGQHNHDELRVRDASHLPDRPCGAPCAKGTAQFGHHQYGKGRIARVGKVLVARPLPCESAQGYPRCETADTNDTLDKAPIEQLGIGAARWTRHTPGSIGSVASASAGKPSVTRLIHSTCMGKSGKGQPSTAATNMSASSPTLPLSK